MDNGLQIRQGTVYQETATGNRLLLIHHNPMSLQSMAIPGTAETFDCAHPALISIDDLINLRKSGQFEELGDVPADVLKQILDAVIATAKGLDENTVKLLEAVRQG
ncbi:MAG: hypothetical protein J6Q65_02300 [Lentisphaeria bacterium]|nr:hypothetical protein [Lentisphaeria bacterium]